MSTDRNFTQPCGTDHGRRCACWHTLDGEWKRNDPLADLPKAQPWTPEDKPEK